MSNFKAGDKVYCLINDCETKIYTVEQNVNAILYPVAIETGIMFTIEGKLYESSDIPSLIHATKENYDLLCKLYPNIEWEEPNKPATPKEVIQAMLDDGWVGVPCWVAVNCKYLDKNSRIELVLDIHDDAERPFRADITAWTYALPFDPQTGKAIIDYIDGNVVLGD